MALADQVVVMNDARIEQAGPPREVFNAPRSEFVARFMGAHNVIPAGDRRVAVRADRMTLHRAPVPDAREAAVHGVEYQGTCVLVKLVPLAGAPDTAWTAAVPDAVFDARPFVPGDRAYVSWPAAAAHALVA